MLENTLIALATAAALIAQLGAQGAPDILTTVGTSTVAGPGGQSQVYLLWSSETRALLKGSRFAIFRKSGDFAAAAPYVFAGFVEAQNSPVITRVLLTRSLGLGGDLGTLERTLDTMLAGTVDLSALATELPDAGDRTTHKLLHLLEAARTDEGVRHSLLLASRNHPRISLILGQAFTEARPAGSRVSYEVRACPPNVFDPDLCTRVLGRVTLVPGQPALLPAPGPPFDVLPEPDDVQQAHLNARLRWSTPDELRRRVVLHFGYEVLRVRTALVAGDDWYSELPDWNAEFARTKPRATRVNRFPVLPSVLLDAAQADPENASGAPADIYFITDNNRRFEEGGAPFSDGAEFTYYVAARDVLGRFGISSPGTEVVIRDRLAPPPPRQLEARSVSHPTSGQAIAVSFLANESPMANGEVTEAYHLYRWSALEDIDNRSAAPAIASFPHADADPNDRIEFLDHAGLPGGPSVPGQVHWYTVRAEDATNTDGAGNGNFSNHSRPVSAALRDLDAPVAPDGTVTIDCLQPLVRTLPGPPIELPALEPVGASERVSLRLSCFKENEGDRFDWVEFWAGGPTGPAGYLARAYFASPDAPFAFASIETDAYPKDTLDIYCRASTRGKVSEFSGPVMLDVSDRSLRHSAYFEAELQVVRAPVGGDCRDHLGGGEPPEVSSVLPSDATSWRILMRVDDGPYQLAVQGARDGDNSSVRVLINALPPYARILCLYLQVFDASGNGSELRKLACFGVRAPDLPQPLLSAPQGLGTPAAPRAGLSWFCPPALVDRFRLFVGIQGDESQVPQDLSDELGFGGGVITPGPAPQHDEVFSIFETGRIAGGFPPVDDATFELSVDVVPGLTYIYYVQAIGPNGEEGPVSNSQTYRWSPPDALYASCAAPLAWPAESVEQSFTQWQDDLALRLVDSRITVSQSNEPGVRGGVIMHIGRLSWNAFTKEPFPTFGLKVPVAPQGGTTAYPAYIFPGILTDVSPYLFEPDLFPFVLYRAMVSSGRYPLAGGETYQVSPMIESFTKEVVSDPVATVYDTETRIFDPHLFLDYELMPDGDVMVDLFVRDTQPVVRGAKYHYLLVNFDARSKEIAKVRSLGTVQIN